MRLGLGGVDQLLVARARLLDRAFVGQARLVDERRLGVEARLLGRNVRRRGGCLGVDMSLDVEHLGWLVGDRLALIGAGTGVRRDRAFRRLALIGAEVGVGRARPFGRRRLLLDGLLLGQFGIDRRREVRGRPARRRGKRDVGGVGRARGRRVDGRGGQLVLQRRLGGARSGVLERRRRRILGDRRLAHPVLERRRLLQVGDVGTTAVARLGVEEGGAIGRAFPG